MQGEIATDLLLPAHPSNHWETTLVSFTKLNLPASTMLLLTELWREIRLRRVI